MTAISNHKTVNEADSNAILLLNTTQCLENNHFNCPGRNDSGLYEIRNSDLDKLTKAVAGTTKLRCHCGCHGARA